jgi:Mrp family chromosome partitioning ATPase
MIIELLSRLNNKERLCFNNSFGTDLDLNPMEVIPMQAVDAVRVVAPVKDRVVGHLEGEVGAAVALAQSDYRVGVLDADITGPSIPKLFGLHGPLEAGSVGIFPLTSEAGVKVMSINLLMQEEDKPVVWRGPMIGKAITQLWGDVMWGELDYLLVDLPPGTSDASLTTLQSIPVSGIIMVTTPQSLASLIVRKAVHMAQLVGTPIIGVVENMSYFKCPDTGKQHLIFGPSHVVEVVQAAAAPLLAQLPINPLVTSLCDAGKVEAVTLPEIAELLNAFLKKVPVIKKAPEN